MYFVDQRKIDELLTYIDMMLDHLVRTSFTSPIEKIALERITNVLIEAVIDVGNMMIDGFIMRDPGSYEDIIDILIDEKVLPESKEKTYKQFINLRKMVVIDYLNVNHEKLESQVIECTDALQKFSSYIRAYLANENKVANAFLNTSGDSKDTIV